MDIWQIDKLALFLLFVVPGFISLKVYDLLVPGPRRDLSSSLVQAVVYSALNFAGLLYPIMLVYSDGFHATPWDILGMYCILFVAPALWAVVWRKLSSSRLLTRHIVHPVQKPWDYVFGRRHSY